MILDGLMGNFYHNDTIQEGPTVLVGVGYAIVTVDLWNSTF